MKRSLSWASLSLVLLLVGCTSSQAPPETTSQLKTVSLNGIKILAGQTVYVPIYSQIYTWEQRRTMDLTATLSVRNTDLTRPIIIAAADYHDGNGRLIRKYLEKPVELAPLAATSFVVEQEDTSGGSGAAFVVEWVAPTETSVPVIEAIMINTGGNQGLSFVSPGRVIKSRSNQMPRPY